MLRCVVTVTVALVLRSALCGGAKPLLKNRIGISLKPAQYRAASIFCIRWLKPKRDVEADMSKKVGIMKVVPGKPFGFVRADDGTEAFVHRSEYKGLMSDGDRIKFDTEDTDKGLRAKDIEVLTRGDPKTTPAPASTEPKPDASKEISVIFTVGKEKLVPTTTQGRKALELPLTITLQVGGRPKLGETVLLSSEGVEVTEPVKDPSSDGKGQVQFTPIINRSNVRHAFVATIAKKKYVYVWEQSETTSTTSKTSTKTNTCKKITAAVEMGQPGYRNVLTITTLSGEDPASDGISCEVTVESQGHSELKIGKDQGQAINVTTDNKGKARRIIFFVAPEWSGNVVVYSTVDPNVHSEPVYIRHPEKASRT